MFGLSHVTVSRIAASCATAVHGCSNVQRSPFTTLLLRANEECEAARERYAPPLFGPRLRSLEHAGLCPPLWHPGPRGTPQRIRRCCRSAPLLLSPHSPPFTVLTRSSIQTTLLAQKATSTTMHQQPCSCWTTTPSRYRKFQVGNLGVMSSFEKKVHSHPEDLPSLPPLPSYCCALAGIGLYSLKKVLVPAHFH